MLLTVIIVVCDVHYVPGACNILIGDNSGIGCKSIVLSSSETAKK